jgi:hypothetical protein
LKDDRNADTNETIRMNSQHFLDRSTNDNYDCGWGRSMSFYDFDKASLFN